MARFYGEIQGNRGEASRMGSADSGFQGHIRGWDVGAAVYMQADGDDDVCTIVATTGSSGHGRNEPIGSLRVVDGKLTLTVPPWLARVCYEEYDPNNIGDVTIVVREA